MDGSSIIEVSDTPPIVSVTVRLWSLDYDYAEEEVSWRWHDRPHGDEAADRALFQTLKQVAQAQSDAMDRRRRP